MNELTIKDVAYHEAGHAVMSALVHRAFGKTVIHDQGGEMSRQNPRKHRRAFIKSGDGYVSNDFKTSTRNLRRDLLVIIAGSVAVSLFNHDDETRLSGADYEQFDEMAAELAKRVGGDPHLILESTCRDAQVRLFVAWSGVESVAAHLLERGSISSRMVREMVNSG